VACWAVGVKQPAVDLQSLNLQRHFHAGLAATACSVVLKCSQRRRGSAIHRKGLLSQHISCCTTLLSLLLQQDDAAAGGGKQQTPPDQAELPPSYGQFLDAHVRRCVHAASQLAQLAAACSNCHQYLHDAWLAKPVQHHITTTPQCSIARH
jgi:hypothetical protein